MLLQRPYFALIAGGIFVVLTSQAVVATPNACKSSARSMMQSCKSERKEEYHATLARCTSFSNSDETNECKQEARTERREAREACAEQRSARIDACDMLGEDTYDDPIAEGSSIVFIDPDDIGESQPNNPYVFLQAGHTHVLRSEEYDPEEDETSVEIIVVHATDEVRDIQGVLCRVVVDIAVEPDEEDGEVDFTALEVTDDWFAQDTDQNVYYCGEISRNYEDGILRDLDGSFEAGLEYAKGGLLTLAMPNAGEAHRQEYALGEAEDIVEYLSADSATPEDEGIDDITGYCGDKDDGECLMTFDFAPLEPSSTEYKYYKSGIGFVQAIALEDGEISEDAGEWLVCSGDSLDIINTDCGFSEDVAEALLEELCDLHDELCDDGEEKDDDTDESD